MDVKNPLDLGLEREGLWQPGILESLPYPGGYHWKTPEEKLEYQQLKTLEQYAEQQGIPNPGEWAEQTLNLQRQGQVTMGAYQEPTGGEWVLPQLPTVQTRERLTAGEQFLGEWGMPLAIPGSIFGGVVPTKLAMKPGVIGKVAKIAKTALGGAEEIKAAKVAKAVKAIEALPEGTRPAAFQKLSGGLDYALKTQRETRQLYREARALRAGKLREIAPEAKGIETYRKQLRALKGRLEKAEFEMPEEFRFTEQDTREMLTYIQKMDFADEWQRLNLEKAIMKFGGQILDETTGLPAQLTKAEIGIFGEVFPELAPIIVARMSMGAKAWSRFIDAANIPRALKASCDFSITLRQLLIGLMLRPQYLPRVVWVQAKAVFSPKNWKMMNEVGLAKLGVRDFVREGMFRAPDPATAAFKLWTKEEQFQTNLASRIPLLGRMIRASERAFTAGANEFRDALAHDYALMLQGLKVGSDKHIRLVMRIAQLPKRQQAPAIRGLLKKWCVYTEGNVKTLKALVRKGTPEEIGTALKSMNGYIPENIRGLAQIINWASGRGAWPWKRTRDFTPIINAFMFSPRFVLSRVYDTPRLLIHSNPLVRKEAWKAVLRLLGTGITVMGLADLAGASVKWNPIATNAGKIKVGNTYIDIWGGYIQYAKFLAQFTMGARQISGSTKEQKVQRTELVQRLFQSKGSPLFSLIVDLISEETYLGEPMYEGGVETLLRELRTRLIPLVADDILEAIWENGIIGAAIAPLPFFGLGIVSYEEQAGGGGLPSLPKIQLPSLP